MIVLVTGGRNYTDRARVFAELDRIHAETPIVLVVHGACGVTRSGNGWKGRLKGADGLADEWAMDCSMPMPVPACWDDEERAGPERNAAMVRFVASLPASMPALCLAFSGGTGTADCVRRARAAGIEVRVVGDESTTAVVKGD